MTSVATPFSFNRTASSTAISSKGFIDILTLAVSTPDPSGLTRTLTLKSTTRLTGTRTFMGNSERCGQPGRRRKTSDYSRTGPGAERRRNRDPGAQRRAGSA